MQSFTPWGFAIQQLKWSEIPGSAADFAHFWKAWKSCSVFVFASCLTWFEAASWNSNAHYDALLRLLAYFHSFPRRCHRWSLFNRPRLFWHLKLFFFLKYQLSQHITTEPCLFHNISLHWLICHPQWTQLISSRVIRCVEVRRSRGSNKP